MQTLQEYKCPCCCGEKEGQPEENPILVCDTTQTGTGKF